MKSILLIILTSVLAFSQLPPSSKADADLSKSEATLRIADWEGKVAKLEEDLKNATSNKEELMVKLEATKKSLQDCKDALNALLGATDADYDAFRQAVGKLEGKVRQKEGLSNDMLADQRAEIEALDAELNKLRMNKLSVHPEFFPKLVDLEKRINNLYREKKITAYSVGKWYETQDCLWNIAKKPEIYNDPNLWPKIWQSNTDQIRNPDIIFPGQVLQIPNKGPKNAEELKAERGYYRQKREAEANGVTASDAGTNE